LFKIKNKLSSTPKKKYTLSSLSREKERNTAPWNPIAIRHLRSISDQIRLLRRPSSLIEFVISDQSPTRSASFAVLRLWSNSSSPINLRLDLPPLPSFVSDRICHLRSNLSFPINLRSNSSSPFKLIIFISNRKFLNPNYKPHSSPIYKYEFLKPVTHWSISIIVPFLLRFHFLACDFSSVDYVQLLESLLQPVFVDLMDLDDEQGMYRSCKNNLKVFNFLIFVSFTFSQFLFQFNDLLANR